MINKELTVVNGMTGKETCVKIDDRATPATILRQIGRPGCVLARVKNRRVILSRKTKQTKITSIR